MECKKGKVAHGSRKGGGVSWQYQSWPWSCRFVWFGVVIWVYGVVIFPLILGVNNQMPKGEGG